jgi:zinc transport system substrate-binding protein
MVGNSGRRLRDRLSAPAWWRLLISALAPLAWSCAAQAAPSVVASIGPLHSLTAAVMGELGAPRQIVRGYGSPHAYQMRPSDAAALHGAELIVWVGPALETFLLRPLEGGQETARVLQLSTLEGLRLLPNRDAGVLGGEGHAHGHAGFDAHVWLSPFNAKVIAAAIAAELGAIDPGNAAAYRHNADRLMQRIDAMEARIAARLAPVRDVPFVMFHDAFQYFEESFGLNAVGSVTVSPDRMPSARRIKALREAMAASGARCVFREPQFESALVQVLLEDTDARSGVLDPLGTDVAPGPDGYIELMNANAEALIACLGP